MCGNYACSAPRDSTSANVSMPVMNRKDAWKLLVNRVGPKSKGDLCGGNFERDG
jgi:hypothetical protein